MKPWREIAIPHADVLKGTFLQSEFAADITAVHTGKATQEYQDAAAFFERTYITEGMRLLLTQVAQRLAGKGGEPVIQLQTAFGGGKTHTMLAVLHLATRSCALSDLPGIPSLIERAGLMDVPKANVAVLDGTAHAPGQPWKHGKAMVRTLWGELAWQLGKADGYALVAEADASGTSPGKDLLRQLLERYAPCVVLMDELVAYIRQFPEGTALSGGTFESNISFVQALTEAAKLVPTAVLLASLPESVSQQSNTNVQVGGARGLAALLALESVFGRVQALWKPVATEEAFEIVRRRLFEPLKDQKARDTVCRAFADAYEAEGAKLPSETHESRYFERLCNAYPIHPEVFDRLYEDWTTIDGFQRTRGVLKLMAKVISRLWKDNNQDLMIMPGSLPLADGDVRNELTYLLPPGWDPVIERDIDGDRAETTELEAREPRLGQANAARRVGRTLFLGTAPSSVATKPGIRGLDRGRVLLGCLQPGQTSAVYLDGLSRLADRLHYLNSSGDKAADSTRFWFDTRANLRREMEDRKRRFDDNTDVRKRIEEVTKKLFANVSMFEGVHVFTAHADVPDDSALRLVILPLEASYAKDSSRLAEDHVQTFLRSHGGQPRHRANRLVFVAADQAVLGRLRDVTRTALAWASIVDDVESNRLNIDKAQHTQAKKEAAAAAEVVPRAARECFKWLLCPAQDDPTATKATVEAFSFNTSSGTAAGELERVCKENELVIDAWSPIHLRSKLKELYWKADRGHVDAQLFWDDSLKYLYLPRLRSHDVLAAAIRAGASSRDFFGVAYGFADGKYEGFQFGKGGASLSDSVLLIAPEVAAQYENSLPAPEWAGGIGSTPAAGIAAGGPDKRGGATDLFPPSSGSSASARAKSFRGSVEVPATLAKSRLNTIAEEVIALLTSDPKAAVRITLEIDAGFPDGASDAIRRGVSENAANLGFNAKDWE
ncbi:MAG: ATP-binding protein [Phycisphaeraceae bacterium]|nr:ATP-binding protein [Phycisphaeraceae bacterium]